MKSQLATQPDKKDSDAMLTKPEVAKLLRVSTKTVERYMLDRRLPFIKLGRTVRFTREGVADLKRRFSVK
jgi:excisionase family DNA binding protein